MIIFLQRSDLLIAAVGLANSRLKVVDLTYPWMFGCYEFLFSVSDDMINTDALVKPFQWPVSLENIQHSEIHLKVLGASDN